MIMASISDIGGFSMFLSSCFLFSQNVSIVMVSVKARIKLAGCSSDYGFILLGMRANLVYGFLKYHLLLLRLWINISGDGSKFGSIK